MSYAISATFHPPTVFSLSLAIQSGFSSTVSLSSLTSSLTSSLFTTPSLFHLHSITPISPLAWLFQFLNSLHSTPTPFHSSPCLMSMPRLRVQMLPQVASTLQNGSGPLPFPSTPTLTSSSLQKSVRVGVDSGSLRLKEQVKQDNIYGIFSPTVLFLLVPQSGSSSEKKVGMVQFGWG